MLPGKTYTPEDILRILWRRKWLIVLPTVLIAGGTFAWSWQLPDVYRAESTILVVPQRIPSEYVRSTVTAELSERLQMIREQILSRTRLEQIIQEFNLYPEERRELIMEDVIAQMRRDINVAVEVRRERTEGGAFRVSYQSNSPRTAMLVAQRVASLFVQENLENRELLADATNQFLQSQVEEARLRLVEHEKKLEDFRRRNAGRLPTQADSNLQMLQTNQMRLQALLENASRDRDRLSVLETQLAEIDATPVVAPVAQVAADRRSDTPVVLTAAQQLEQAQTTLRQMELRLRPEHPDMVRARRVIAELEKKAEAEALQQPVSPDTGAPPAPVASDGRMTPLQTRRLALRTEVQEIRLRLESYKGEQERLQQALGQYTARIEASPALESEMTELMRDYTTIQTQYQTLLGKSEQSKLAVDLERRQIGEQFRILDAARPPERPISPDRQRLNMMGLLAGLGLGLGLVGLLEYRDTTLKTDMDVVTSLALPVLAVVPRMVTSAERARHRRRMRLTALAVSLVMLLAAGGVVVWQLGLLAEWVN